MTRSLTHADEWGSMFRQRLYVAKKWGMRLRIGRKRLKDPETMDETLAEPEAVRAALQRWARRW